MVQVKRKWCSLVSSLLLLRWDIMSDALRGTCSDAKTDDALIVDLETDHKSQYKYFAVWKTVGHVPREISRDVYNFIKQEGRVVNS